jgi:hypothetical protein
MRGAALAVALACGCAHGPSLDAVAPVDLRALANEIDPGPIAHVIPNGPKDPAELYRIYHRAIAAPYMARLMNGIGSMMGVSIGDQFNTPIGDVAEKGWKHYGAQVLREGTRDQAIAEVLAGAGGDFAERHLYTRARGLYAASLRRSANPDAGLWLSFADACFRSGDLEQGRAALAWATRKAASVRGLAGRRLQRKLAFGEKLRAAAEELARLDKATSLADRVRHAALLIELNHVEAAVKELEVLVREHPDDARPMVNLVRARFSLNANRFDFGDVNKHLSDLAAAARLPHADRLLHATVVGLLGLRAVSVIRKILTDIDGARAETLSVIAELRAAADALAAFDPGRAAALKHIVEVFETTVPRVTADSKAEEWMPPIVAGMYSKGSELRAQFPTCADGYAMQLMGAAAADKQRALDTIAQRPSMSPQASPSVYLERARALVGLMARWELLRFDVARAALDEVPAIADQDDAVALAGADLLAVRAALQRRGWSKVADAYGALAETATSANLPRVLNNWGYALIQSGKRADGLHKLRQAATTKESTKWIPRMNLALAEPPAARLEAFKRLIDNEGTTISMSAWEAHYNARAGKTDAAGRSARSALKSLRTDTVGPRHAWGHRGMIVVSSFQMGLGLSSASDDYQLSLRIDHPLWLTDPVPLDEKGLEALARAVLVRR